VLDTFNLFKLVASGAALEAVARCGGARGRQYAVRNAQYSRSSINSINIQQR
jgi:hypothetical protein